ncbi:MAG: 30S ribosomal protein S3 [Candidatus Bathyarchaeota archaeon]|jgi:small subunit ribosomal protein S3|nr:30S ribosomal protein S3 [Candidatus Bathyarchaeota archaeon]
MSIVNHFINESMRQLEINDFLERELTRAGFGGAEIMRTPLGTRIIIYAMKPGVVIGRRGTNIRELTRLLEEKFELFNPQIAVSEVEVPELNANIMASRIADALQRGIHFRRTGFWALNQIMRAGAMGCEVIIKGKLTSRRHRYEKYREGYIPRVGDPALKNVHVANIAVKMRPGIIGVTVKIIPPDAVFPDQVEIRPPIPKELPPHDDLQNQELTPEEE